MSIGILSALKVIPWGDVIAAAPTLVKGAKDLFARKPVPPPPPAAEDASPSLPASQRIAALESRVAELERQNRQMAEVTASLAEQSAKVVEAIDILRVRTRLLLAASGVLGLLLVAAVALSYSGFGSR